MEFIYLKKKQWEKAYKRKITTEKTTSLVNNDNVPQMHIE